tara:strand:+ start:982 stop:1293 length:312 start_codon:yes stop_codon:yes gene_type:complete
MKNRMKHIPIMRSQVGKFYINQKFPEIPSSINDLYVITTSGDRLDLLAEQFYKDVRLWWVIPAANMDKISRDSFALKPGIEIRIPANIKKIIRDFETVNRPKS